MYLAYVSCGVSCVCELWCILRLGFSVLHRYFVALYLVPFRCCRNVICLLVGTVFVLVLYLILHKDLLSTGFEIFPCIYR